MRASALTTDDEAAARANATWKFDFLDIVNADPKAGGACLAVIKAYLHFASKARPQAFCSLPELMLRTGGSRPRVLRAKVTLEKLGYLVPMYVTDEGATMYRLVNARKQLIDDHLRIAREKLAAEKRDRKRRQRSGGVQGGGNETILPDFDHFERNDTLDILREMEYTNGDGSRNAELDRVVALQRVLCTNLGRLREAAEILDGPKTWVPASIA
ncbi:hypothetical protein [Rhizobium johnstonii]|uniref:hypothetical protein n=1 Tax=Rhizobium johnstonii TaxID=3019933 RepID=UPI003F9B4E09